MSDIYDAKITHLRLYKPDGQMLEFKVGETTGEGYTGKIEQFDSIFTVTYYTEKGKSRIKSYARFSHFPYAVRLIPKP